MPLLDFLHETTCINVRNAYNNNQGRRKRHRPPTQKGSDMKLSDAIEMASGLAFEEDENQIVGMIQGEWAVAGIEHEGRVAEMSEPKFIVTSGGVEQGHIDRGEITEDWELPTA